MSIRSLIQVMIVVGSSALLSMVLGQNIVIDVDGPSFPPWRQCTISRVGELHGHPNSKDVPSSTFIGWIKDGQHEKAPIPHSTNAFLIHGSVFNAPDASDVYLEVSRKSTYEYGPGHKVKTIHHVYSYVSSYTVLVSQLSLLSHFLDTKILSPVVQTLFKFFANRTVATIVMSSEIRK